MIKDLGSGLIIIGIALMIVALSHMVVAQQTKNVDLTVDPMKWAQEIWGGNAQIAQINRGHGWVYQVGCFVRSQTVYPDFVIAGEGSSWKAAFESVDPERNGPSKYIVLENGLKVQIPVPQDKGITTTYQCNAGKGMKP